MDSDSDEYFCDAWPIMPNGREYDGNDLLNLTRSGNNPFHEFWDVEVLIQEVEEHLGTRVVDIISISSGSNNYGIHFKLSNRPDVLARLSRSDVNRPKYDGFPVARLVSDQNFEATAYEIFRSEPGTKVSRMICHRVVTQRPPPYFYNSHDITGRSLLLFEKAEGENNVWWELGPEQQQALLAQAAKIRASLFNFKVPLQLAQTWLLDRLFDPKPNSLPIPVAPTRQFCVGLLTSKVEATITNIGEMIGWESDNAIVGPIAFAAKQSLLRFIPHMLPEDGDQDINYRFVIEHGDFGLHNMTIASDENFQPLITSIYDFETGNIVPAILSGVQMAVIYNLGVDENATPKVSRMPNIYRMSDDATPQESAMGMPWARQYIKVLFEEAPDYERVIKAGKDARHLWFTLKAFRGDDPEGYFGKLGEWAETRMKELGIN